MVVILAMPRVSHLFAVASDESEERAGSVIHIHYHNAKLHARTIVFIFH